MKRYFRYLLLAFVAVACVNENELSEPFLDQDGEAILVPRVKSFTNQYVTKAGYAQDEAKITSLAVLVFNSKGEYVHHEEVASGNLSSITLNKTYLAQKGDMKGVTLVMFANIRLDEIKKDGVTLRTALGDSNQPTLTGLQDYAYHFDEAKTVITDLGNGFAGFPMTGRVDGIDLSATLEPQAPIEIGLRILYAKVNFSISVAPGSENEGRGMQFVLDGYSVHNVSKVTSYKELQGSEATVSTDYAYHQEGYSVAQTGTATLSAGNPLTFTFYLAESRFAHGLTNFNGIYPAEWLTSAQDDDVKNYTQLSPEEQAKPENWLNGVKYHYDGYVQQYKPLVANASADAKPGQGLATYVLVKGAYTDYRGTVWDVNYKVYLGKDNGQNFQVDRNSEYKNYLTIKGIRNNDSNDGRGEVWFDHRVDVSNPNSDEDASDCVTITRETLIDAHIEVRPLRVTWPNDKYAGVRVYLPTNSDTDGSLVNWIGMERFTGTNNQDASVYCYLKNNEGSQVSTGKRKYFTTSLISELQTKEGELGVHEDDGQKYIYLMNEECAWIYFDENLTATGRTAKIRLAFYDTEGNVKVKEIYEVTQRGLLSLGGHAVEHYEEYLHTYDSADQYNLSTSPVDYTQQGLSWGLVDKKISKDIIVSAVPLEVGILGFQDWVTQRYDYFHQSDRPSGDTYYPYRKGDDGNWSNSGYGTGLIFTDRASENEVITVKDMGTIPDNAYQYCLSKNKFSVDDDGNVSMKIHWYLPDVYEMRDVLNANAAPQGAVDFGTNAYYWTSQPSFGGQLTNNIALIDEVTGSARAVSASSASTETPGVDEPRHVQHRIRCLYSSKGIEANMDNRTPDGVGGNYTFTMKAYESNSNAPGYFNYMLPEAKRNEEGSFDDYDYTNESFPIPTASNPGTEFDYFSGAVDQNQTLHSGFKKNPTDDSNWQPYERLGQKYYYTLYSYPGLSEYEFENALLANASRPTTTKKSDKKVEREVKSTALSKPLTNASLNALDHLKGGKLLNIVFANGNNSEYHPQYAFVEIEKGSFETQTVRNWRVPTYPETSYTPSPDIKTEVFTGEGSASETGLRGLYTEAKESAENQAKEQALAKAEAAAKQKYPNRQYDIIEGPTYTIETDYDSQKAFGIEISRTYYSTVTCTVTIQCTAAATPVPYYALPENWGWYEVESKTVDLAKRETDELHIYGGNSFTISVTDPDYEITKVKVHYSGNNVISSNGLFSDKVVQRFVDAEEDYPENQIIYRTAEASLQMPGMEYSTDGEKGWHQWTGSGRASVTLELAEYAEVEQGVIYRSCGFRDAQNLSKYLIIDKIEVKCTKKPEAQP